ncbi:hypothetical protein LJC32_05460 [Oscillospiraceae bacterium OttesenSCG-928-F05]|nr:hypothetical protein [Oscillospiraceae bacterium OttesenSCG-928-F05]
MNWSSVKNIMIFILVGVNLLTGCIFLLREYERQQTEITAEAEAYAALCRLVPIVPSDIFDGEHPLLYTLEARRDREAEARALFFLIGEGTATELGGGIVSYEGRQGYATALNNGSFEVFLADGIPLEGGEEAVGALLRKAGFPETTVPAVSSRSEAATYYTATQLQDGHPLFGCDLTVRVESGDVTYLGGTAYFGAPTAVTAPAEKSLSTILLNFAGELIDEGTPCRQIFSAVPGFIASQIAPGVVRLEPTWEIDANSKPYYVDAYTGKIAIFSTGVFRSF